MAAEVRAIRKVLNRYPFLSLVGVFLTTGGVVIGFAYSLALLAVASAECPKYHGDPCDAAPLLAMSILTLSIPVSVIAAAFTTFVVYFLYVKR